MDYGHHPDPFFFRCVSVNDPVWGNDDFAVSGPWKFGDEAPALWELPQSFSGAAHTANHNGRILS